MQKDARITVREIARHTGLSSGSVHQVLRNRLKLRKIFARWIPHILSDEQKRGRVQVAKQLLKKYDNCDQRRLSEIVTGDETWVYFYQPERKEKNKVWVSKNGKKPEIAVRTKTVKKVLYAIFFDGNGVVVRFPVPKGKSVTGNMYANDILPKVFKHYETQRPRTGTRGIKLLHDNAPAHTSRVVTEYLRTNKLETLPHPPYSPDLAPCDFWLFPKLKAHLSGKRFQSRHAVGSAIFQYLNTIPKMEYKAAFTDWIKRLKKCIHFKGEYFEQQA